MLQKCKICSKEFSAKLSHVKIGWGNFCSSTCHYVSMKKGNTVLCDECRIPTYKSLTKLASSKSGKFFCSKSCQTKWRNKVFSGNKHANWILGESTYRKVLKDSGVREVCTRCKKDDIRILVAHHIDHNRKNYDVKNLMWLCRNCHFVVHCDKLEEVKLLQTVSKI